MTDEIVAWVESLMTAAAFYPILSGVVLLDSLFPLIPSETIITLAGAWSGSRGVPHLGLVLLAAVIGAVIGDNLCYFFGTRLFGVVGRIPGGSRRGKALTWARRNLNERDISTLIIARFIPWARWTVTIMMGSVRYPWRRFLFWDTVGVIIWALQTTLLGYLGGWLFREQPLIGLAMGVLLGTAVGIGLERGYRAWENRCARRTARSSRPG